MNKKVILFCGVESTGKTTMIEQVFNHLKNKGLTCQIVSEVGREVCALSGGVDEMTILDYELILHKHQTNFLQSLYSDCDIILLDTDSIYTRYYLEKDQNLYNQDVKYSKKLVKLSENIVKSNLKNKRISHVFYLDSLCDFVQDGTRTYEKTRSQDDKYLYKLYSKMYSQNCTFNKISGRGWNQRTQQVIVKIEQYLKHSL